MEGTGSNLRLPMNPPFFFESNVVYDKSSGPGTITTGFAELVPGTTPSGNVRPSPRTCGRSSPSSGTSSWSAC